MRSRIFGAALLALVATSSTVRAAPEGAPAKDTITIAFGAESTTLDPIKAAAGVDYYFIGQMFEQLQRQTPPDGKTVNWLAESYTVDPNGGKPIIDVHIRPGVKFHNGDPLTSEDFEFAYNRAKDPKQSRLSHLQASIERFEIVDDLHFRLHFSEADATYVSDNLRLWAIPKKYFQRIGEVEFGLHPVGTGPWKFVSRSVKNEIRFEAFDDYWNKEHRPTVKNLVIKIIPEDLTRVAAFKSGAVDLIDAIPLVMVPEFKTMPGVETATVNTGNNLYIQFATNIPNSPFNDLRVRQAAAHAIDMDAIIKNVLFGQGERYNELGKGEFGYDPDLKPLPYDPKKARELLAAAGYPRGFDVPCVNLTTPREPNIKEYGEAVYAYLSAVGIRCRIQGVEYSAWLTAKRRWPEGSSAKSMEGMISDMYGHGALPGDPGTAWMATLHSFEPGKGYGASSYTSEKDVDDLIEAQRREMDPDKRRVIVQQIAKIKSDRLLGGITTYRPLATFAWHSNIRFVPWPTPPGIWAEMQEIGYK